MNLELFAIALTFISFYGHITSKSIVKSVVALILMEMAIVMFFLSIGFTGGMTPPIGQDLDVNTIADPFPQALVITTIILGVAITAINLTVLITLSRQYHTMDWDVVREKIRAEKIKELE